ncbi:ATP-binding protein [Streptomyces sp. LBUM 1478]|uniref:ATP/GTP-binding protein n=1 Tax=Streptomyces caniscabiei TaxID=2746961 RepID=A0A927QDW0_9ACTN|nr:ATP/GTP-binding protein [Streptomyces caniscabiei]KFG02946.1 ATP-binding protein [Streptomyces scabiei]MBP5861360.1 ATP-binding protein [Streptomyces sp. LBUM 1484]MBP5869707.1 ATP-binding protein [Streptomyces sp. LBUM 1485]MBP5878206.1 ATP-binding protein [Streptomyces sp. LBUM 1477]MBP5886043.1 ATP-binding protein [Streptomyces sp. LBUM 1487]MBP5902018.1 ATP-binding protein [Streptomyces sp. LBUM 1488]MBP5908110.1 ATP-binding protein [Streptomyces sp. LBUM 1478]MBP5914340.1 ATP-bindin
MPGSPAYVDEQVRYLVKFVVAGGLGVGKTTLIRTVSEITARSTEAVMTASSIATDSLTLTPQKSTTTVALDFGRRTIDDEVILYLFGAPGQSRFITPLWPALSQGALGVLVLVDIRRLQDCHPFLDLVERAGLPYTVAVNRFPDTPDIAEADLRGALDLADTTPLVMCNALDRLSCLDALITLARQCLARARLDPVS